MAMKQRIIALLLFGGFPACSSSSKKQDPAPITISGDFVWDHRTHASVLADEISAPVKVPWHPGMTLASALHEAGVHPFGEHSGLKISRESKVIATGIVLAKHRDFALMPGDRISYWGLEF
jgi:hypothetical protein